MRKERRLVEPTKKFWEQLTEGNALANASVPALAAIHKLLI